MDAVTYRITYDRKSRTKLKEERTGTKVIPDDFDIQFIDSLVKGLIDAGIIKKACGKKESTSEMDIA
ncbi:MULTISPECIES: hypothetical protein [unclassified Clostridium]|uniref:hypothetical protein n=1 Tax=unclassified Clostridium TaxID=2614128 RepID=UPI0002980A9E|nr:MULTISPECIES: hypothetical protein [unclassified Clostridium]EKQ57252.1 MAG: hypothetical protein A370_01069 [Clostridium sp. Maddingley MBC34-26]